MQKNELLITEDKVYRVLNIIDDDVLIIDCMKKTMPVWENAKSLNEKQIVLCVDSDRNIENDDSCSINGLSKIIKDLNDYYRELPLSPKQKQIMHERFTMISNIFPVVGDKKRRSRLISEIAGQNGISKQTVRKYFCDYLVYQDIRALAPKPDISKRQLTRDEKNFRWALNKFYYNTKKNSLKTAYRLMLKEKYCDNDGLLPERYPTFYQFRYFYRKTYKKQTALISREGLSKYQRDNRPLLGDGVRDFCNHVGIGMMDATVCDIYLVDDGGNVIGRPVLTACVDGYSSLCCGISVTLEGGVYSLRDLMLNVISDKVEYCRRLGILIKEEEWTCSQVPGKLITDMGSEYISDTFCQITELGVTLENLPPYRPDLKSEVEKFFDLVQESYKPYLKGKGVIEEDFQERGGHDYRKDACLTLEDFEKIVIKCAIHYNNKRIIESFPYTEEMLDRGIPPFASSFWNYGVNYGNADLISVTKEELLLHLLPRKPAQFSRKGLKVNKLRYRNDNYVEEFLSGKEAVVAYNPENVSNVWLLEKGAFVKFDLIESRYKDKNTDEVQDIRKRQRDLLRSFEEEKLQSEIQLAAFIQTLTEGKTNCERPIKDIRENRRRERAKQHIDMVSEVLANV